MFATFKLAFVYLALGPIAGIVGIPYTLLVGDISLLYRVAMWITNAGVRAAGIKIEVTGLGEHSSWAQLHFYEQPRLEPRSASRASSVAWPQFCASEEGADEHPNPGQGDALAKFVPVERGHRREAAQASVEAAADALRVGTASSGVSGGYPFADGRLSAFKKGPFYLAMETQAPIVPIAISGTQTMMHKGSNAIKPGLARIQMLPAVEPSHYETREELMDAVRSAIAEALPPEMKPAI